MKDKAIIPSFKEYVNESVETKRQIQNAFKEANSLTDVSTIKSELIENGADESEVEYYFKIAVAQFSKEGDDNVSGATNTQVNTEEDNRLQSKEQTGASPETQKDKSTW